MKISEEQCKDLELLDFKIGYNRMTIQNCTLLNQTLLSEKDRLLHELELIAREAENKPIEKFNCNLDMNTLEITFTEKEV